MIRGTTPDYILTIDGYDLTDKTVFVTIRQGTKKITKTRDDLNVAYSDDASTIAFLLSQRDTLSLTAGSAFVQVRFIDSDGIAYATEIKELIINKVLLERVISYE